MKTSRLLSVVLLTLFLMPAYGQEPLLKKLEDPVEERLQSAQSTQADQTDVAVTVYNSNRALVRDRRALKMLPGEHPLRFMDVASAIIPETVNLRSLNDSGALHILEQNYEYDLMSPDKLMEKYVGKEVLLVNKNTDYDFYEQPATLLSVNNGPVYKVENKIYLGHPGYVVLPEIPSELFAKPTLVWLLDNQGTDHEVEVSYMTNDINWQADYVLTMNREETLIDLEGWVTLNNQSGTAYRDAQLKLVAGDVNVASRQYRMQSKQVMADMAMASAAPMMEEEAFSEYHLYTLERRTTIANNQTKQVSLLRGNNVTVEKEYEFRGDTFNYSAQAKLQQNIHAAVFLKFKNSEENGLGIPLPAGVMRVYQADKSGMLQFSGEDRIQHIPKNENVRLTLGRAFDVVADRVQTEQQWFGPKTNETAFTISVRNRKETPITVDLIEPMLSDNWEIIEESAAHVKRDAQTIVYTLAVDADSEAILTYRVKSII